MGKFNALPTLTPLADGENWRLDSTLVYTLDKDLAKEAGFDLLRIDADEGYITDGASIPRFLWSIVGSPMAGKYRRPAIVHDWLCDNWRLLDKSRVKARKLGDLIFKRAMKDDGVSWFKRQIIYSGVRAYALLCVHD